MKKEFNSNKTTYIKAFILEIFVTAIIILVFAFIMLFTDLNIKYASLLATLSIGGGCFFASYYSARKIGNRGYFIGFIIGVATFLIITVISLIINDTALSINTLFHFIIIMLSSLIGGIFGVNKDKNKKII